MLAIATVIEEPALGAIPAVEEVHGAETLVGIDEIGAKLAVIGEDAELAVLQVENPVAVSEILIVQT